MAPWHQHQNDCAIVLCANHAYFPPAYALAMSLARDQAVRHDTYILTEAGTHLQRLPHDVPFKVLTPEFINQLPNVPERWHPFTQFAYLRLFIPGIVEGYRRVLYLDCDIRIDGALAPLLTIDMQGATIAAVDDVCTYFKSPVKERITGLEKLRGERQTLGLDPKDPYFNSGVLLIDCEQWQRERMTDVTIDCMARLRAFDQDVLNVVFRNAWLPLSPRWNFPVQVFETDVETVIKPVVYHNFLKAWKFDEANRREAAYFQQAVRNTPYSDFVQRPSFRQLRRYTETRAKRLLQYATFFLPSSQQRIRALNASYYQRAVAAYLVENVKSRRFADVAQGISKIDVPALSALL
jgi:lipopolysaccharide biosynthesis glycosyltransferase